MGLSNCKCLPFRKGISSRNSSRKNVKHAVAYSKTNKESLESEHVLKSRNDDISRCDEADVDKELLQSWIRMQKELKSKLILNDDDYWSLNKSSCTSTVNEDEYEDENEYDDRSLKYIGGVDISFVKNDLINACAALIIVSLPDLEVVYSDCSLVSLTQPYVAGFLAFREVQFLVEKVKILEKTHPEYMPQVILVDGNGILHHSYFGLACHLGVLTGIPTIGVAKNLLQVHGLEKNDHHKAKIKDLKNGGDLFYLYGDTDDILGVAYRSMDLSPNPIYISQGHRVSKETMIWTVKLCCKYRIPEPVRQADIQSREYLRKMFGETKTDPT